MVNEAPTFNGLVQPYMENSYVMSGNYSRGFNFTLESESYQLSGGKVSDITFSNEVHF